MNVLQRSVAISFIILTAVTAGFSEDEYFRVGKTHTVAVPADFSEIPEISASYNDGIYVTFPADTTFIRAIEFEITVPKSLVMFRDSLGYAVYSGVTPQSKKASNIDFTGNRETIQPFPSRLKISVQVPLAKDGLTKGTPYTTVVNTVIAPSAPILFRLMPLMKGLPDNIPEYIFAVRIKPILIPKGRLQLNITYPPDETAHSPITVSIGDTAVELNDGEYILDTGMHQLSVMSENYRTAIRTVSIEQGKTTELEIELQDTDPKLQIIAPENAVILFDGEPLPDGMFRTMAKTTPGEHLIQFAIGDYAIQRTILIEKAKNYSVSLLINIETTVLP